MIRVFYLERIFSYRVFRSIYPPNISIDPLSSTHNRQIDPRDPGIYREKKNFGSAFMSSKVLNHAIRKQKTQKSHHPPPQYVVYNVLFTHNILCLLYLVSNYFLSYYMLYPMFCACCAIYRNATLYTANYSKNTIKTYKTQLFRLFVFTAVCI